MLPLYLKDATFQEPAEATYYLLTRDGLYLARRGELFTTELRVQGLPWLAPHAERASLHLPARVPARLVDRAIAFFQAVFRRMRSEAILLLYYLPAERRYELLAPAQDVTPFTCQYTLGPTPDGWVRVGSLHSHGELEAGHSDVDAEDERFEDGLHFTIGGLDALPRVACELAVAGRRFPVPLAEVVEPRQEAPFPTEWLASVNGLWSSSADDDRGAAL
jgi:hypothetical protein